MSYITPLSEEWLAYQMPRSMRVALADNKEGLDKIESWFKRCSEIVLEELSSSNFYTIIHSCFKDRTIIGTGGLGAFLSRNRKPDEPRINFKYLQAATYCFTENANGRPERIFVEIKMTLQQMLDEYGEDGYGEKITEAMRQAKEKPEMLHNTDYPIVVCIMPRKDYDPVKVDTLNKPFSEEHVCSTDKVVIREGGYDEFPHCISRYERWNNEIWGFAPAYNALPNVLSANYIRKLLKTMGEIALFPRIFKLAGQKRQIDLRAGGQTMISEKEAQLGYPKEFGTQARYDVGMELISQDHDSIEKFFHVPLFRMFATLDKQMTATEVAAREREKLLLFAPSFTQFVTDMTPMMVRIFALLARDGAFPAPPEELVGEDGSLPLPDVVFQSKVAMAIKALQAEGFDRILSRVMPILEMSPDVLDNFDFDTIIRDMARSEGLRERWLTKIEEMKKTRDARMQAQQAQQEAQMAEQMAGAVGKAGGAEGIEQLAETAGAAQEEQ